jgi:hypothetical protein
VFPDIYQADVGVTNRWDGDFAKTNKNTGLKKCKRFEISGEIVINETDAEE